MTTRRRAPTGARQITLELPEHVSAAIEEAAARTGRDFGSVASELLAEAVKVRQHPGISFFNGPRGRRARIAGTDVEVAAIVGRLNHSDGRWEALRGAFPGLTDEQLRAALTYSQAFPNEIADQLDADNRAFFEAFWEAHPESRPASR